MRECKYLDGENVAPRTAAEARALIGKRIKYLMDRDIDRSGRGYFFPQYGRITSVHGRHVEMNGTQDYQRISRFVEAVLEPSA